MRIVKAAVSCAVYLWDAAGDVLLKTLRRRREPRCTVLYYHSVPFEQRRKFGRQLDAVRRYAIPIACEDATHLRRGENYCCVTFDDGFEDTVKVAVPELIQRGVPATVFIAAGWTGKMAGWWPVKAPESHLPIASDTEIRELPAAVLTVGSHAVTHSNLANMHPDDARRELAESREMLSRIVGYPVFSFSFPYGGFRQEMAQWCRDAGYTSVFTSAPAFAFRSHAEFVHGRVAVSPEDSTLEFFLKIHGAYRWIPFASRAKRALGVLIRPFAVFSQISRRLSMRSHHES